MKTAAATISEALAERAALHPTATAIEIGGEAPVSYQALLEETRSIAAQIAQLGLRKAQGVVIVSRARARVPALVHGAMLAGAVAVSIEPSTPPAQLRSFAARAHTRIAVGDPDLLEWLTPKSMVPLYPGRPQDPHIAVIDDPPPIVPPLDAPTRVREGGDQLALLIFTSGSTGVPKGVLLSHANMLASARRMTEARGHHLGDRHLSYLSFAHLAELFMSIVLPVASGYTVVFPRGRRLTEAIAATRPTFFMGVPAEWQTIATAAAALPGTPEEIRAALGLDRIRVALSTGAALAAEAHEALRTLGLPAHEMYGMTETSGAASYNAPGRARPGSVGSALPGSRLALDSDGEVQLFGAIYRCQGYIDDPHATQGLFVGDDGVRTGDLGSLDDDGYLYVTGRKKDLLVLSTGKKIHPGSIEARLGALTDVRHAAVFGEGKHHLVAVLDAVADPRLRTAPRTREETRTFVGEMVRTLNKELEKHERIAAIGIAPQPFSIQSGELTPSLKIRREIVRERHRLLIDALLGGTSASEAVGDIVRFIDG